MFFLLGKGLPLLSATFETVGAIPFSRVGFGVEGPEKGDEGGREGE